MCDIYHIFCGIVEIGLHRIFSENPTFHGGAWMQMRFVIIFTIVGKNNPNKDFEKFNPRSHFARAFLLLAASRGDAGPREIKHPVKRD